MIRSFLIAVSIAIAVAAPAQAASESMIRWVERELPQYVDDVDVRSLSSSQISALYLIMNNNNSQSRTRAQVRSVLGGLDVLLFGRNLSF